MAVSISAPLLHHRPISVSPFQSRFHHSTSFPSRRALIPFQNPNPNPSRPLKMVVAHAGSVHSAVSEAMKLMQSSPPTWPSALLTNLVIFVLGSPILVSGLSLPGIGAAFLLGTLTWRAFGPPGFILVATYFIIVSSTKNMKRKEKKFLLLLTTCVWDLICLFIVTIS